MDARLLSSAQADDSAILGVRDTVRLCVLDREGCDDEVRQCLRWDLWNSYDLCVTKRVWTYVFVLGDKVFE